LLMTGKTMARINLMAFEQRVTLHGSEKKPLAGAERLAAVNKDETVSVTLVLRRKGSDPAPAGGGRLRVLARAEFGTHHGATAEHLKIVEAFAQKFGLTVRESNAAKRIVRLSGSAAAMEQAFGTTLHYYEEPKVRRRFRGRTGALTVPAELEQVVVAVLGLDNRPTAKPHIRHAKAAAAPPAGTFTPPQVAALYNFPTKVTGAGQTIGIIELGGGYHKSDLTAYFKELGLAVPAVTDVSVDGGANTPGSDADGEVVLDIEIAGSVANGAKIAVYFAPNTDQGFYDAIVNAVHDTVNTPSVISISWGQSEDGWTSQSRTAMNMAFEDAASLGVTITAASGDDGSSDGTTDGKDHVDFPASSPYVLACGGTKLKGSKGTITSEVVWNEISNNEGATGGGVSQYFPIPTWQANAGVPAAPSTSFAGRGVPDVAGNADPTTGYLVRLNGQDQVIGGTSAVAPLCAALIALINQQKGSAVGFINPGIYQNASAFRDITQGNNGDFNAGPGWDACTGLGSPNGVAVATALAAS
jgi:kumamolisin